MALPKYEAYNVSDPHLTKVQYKLQEALGPIFSVDLLDGNLITGVDLTNVEDDEESPDYGLSTATVPHRLERDAKGYIVVKRDANAVIYDRESSNTNKSRFLKLMATASVTIDVWVF